MNAKMTCMMIAFVSMMATQCLGQEDTLEQSLMQNVPAWMAENHVPCVGVGLIKDGRIKWLKTFGELQKGYPAPGNTLFNIASQTKPVVAMLTLKLVQA